MKDFESQIATYLKFCQNRKNLNPKTVKAYRIDLAQFSQFAKDRIKEPIKDIISDYISYLHNCFKPKTVKRKIATIKAFFNHLEYEEIIEQNPFVKIRTKFKEPFTLPKTIPLNVIQAILDSAYTELQQKTTSDFQYKTVQRDIAVLELLFATGVRVSELCSLTIKDVDINNKFIKIYGKGSKERLIQLGNSDVILALENYANAFKKQTNESGYFFVNKLNNRLSEQSIRFMIKKHVQKCNISIHITPHMFRHSFATLLLEEDVDIRYIQKLLGHSSIVTTQIYTHVTSRKQMHILTTKHPRNKLLVNKG